MPKPSKPLTDHSGGFFSMSHPNQIQTYPFTDKPCLNPSPAFAPTFPTSTNVRHLLFPASSNLVTDRQQASRNVTTNYSTTTLRERASKSWSKNRTKTRPNSPAPSANPNSPVPPTRHSTSNSSPNCPSSSTCASPTSTPASRPWSRFSSASAPRPTPAWPRSSSSSTPIPASSTPKGFWIVALSRFWVRLGS